VPVKVAAWHDKSSYGVVATEEFELNPALEHWMYQRSSTNRRMCCDVCSGSAHTWDAEDNPYVSRRSIRFQAAKRLTFGRTCCLTCHRSY
jgi:hypothetical protein